jgi:5-methylcytosine-specific restriction protein A
MPTRPQTPCRHPGCPALVYERGGYCTAHKSSRTASGRLYDATTRKDDPELAFAKTTRSSARWTRTSRLFKSTYPLCCDPFKEHGEYPPLTDHVHHVVSLRQCHRTNQHDLAFDWANLRPLCTGCHRRIEGMENRGENTAALLPALPQANEGFGIA